MNKHLKRLNLDHWPSSGEPKINDENLIKMRDALNETGPGFCLAKWTQVTMHLGSGLTHSCHHVQAHKIHLDELEKDPSALHNTEFKKERRMQMKQGKRPVECDYCWRIEDNSDHFSDRVLKSMEPWSLVDYGKIKTSVGDENIYPRHVEVSFSNVCNFKCSYCGPAFSSKWTEEVKSGGTYKHTPHKGPFRSMKEFGWINPDEIQILEREENPYIDAFWNWFPEAVKHMHTFRITGGEPLLSKNTMRVIDYLLENPQPHIRFAINTNACPPTKVWADFLEKVKLLEERKVVDSITIYTSAEATGEQCNYIRDGMDYDLWFKNINTLMETTEKVNLSLMAAFNLLSLTTLDDFLQDITKLNQKFEGRNIWVDFPYVRNPKFLDVRIATPELRDKFFKPVFEKWDTYDIRPWEKEKLRRIYDSCDATPGDDLDITRYNFWEFIMQYDKRRGKDFLSTFPEFEDFFNLCKISNV